MKMHWILSILCMYEMIIEFLFVLLYYVKLCWLFFKYQTKFLYKRNINHTGGEERKKKTRDSDSFTYTSISMPIIYLSWT